MKAIWNRIFGARSDRAIVATDKHCFPANSTRREYLNCTSTPNSLPMEGPGARSLFWAGGAMIEPDITVYGAYWCPDCRRSKQFLGEHQIPYRWVDIEQDKAGESYVLAKNDGKRIIPTIEFADGSILVEPSNAALATKLGLKMVAERSHYDLIVVGGGPAGLTAALVCGARRDGYPGHRARGFGGQAAATERLDNMPGFADGIEGAKFADQLRLQAARFGVEMLQAQDVVGMRSHDNYHCVGTPDGSEYSSRAPCC